MNWTFPLFRVFGIKVRMHWAMAILILFYLIQGLDHGSLFGLGMMAITMVILLISILFHEFAHCWMAVRTGGSAEDILLWPLGGLSTLSHSNSPGVEMKVAGIGPLSSFVLSAGCYAGLYFSGVLWHWRLLSPFDDWGMEYSLARMFLLHAARLNLYLGIFNLLVPAYPLDGGTSRPLTRWRSHCRMPPVSNATAGTPIAAASRPTRPKGSGQTLGTARTAAFDNASAR